MKKRRAALAILSCALLTGGLVSCGGETEEPIYVKNEIVSISIKTAPTKTIYKVGETFDPTGVVIESNWKDGSKKIVTKYTYDNHNPLTLQDKVITFSYEGFTCTQEITVREVKITGIEIKEKPFKTEYKIGQTFDPKGLVVVAKYEDNSTLTLSDKDYTIKDATRALTEADKEMIVQYKTFTASIAITVVDQIDVTIDDLETVRVEAENLDFSKAILRNDFAQAGRSFVEEPTGGAASGGKSICGYELNSIFEVRFEVKENATILIKAGMADLGKNYSLAEALEFKVDDKVLVAEDKPFGTNGYWDWCEFSVGVVELAKGKHTFSVKAVSARPNMDYFDFVATKYGDKEVQKELIGYDVKSAPTKTHYIAGEEVDLTGLVLTAKYNDNSTEDITEGFVAKKKIVEITDTEIVAVYNEHEFAFKITVEGHVDYVVDDVTDIVIEGENLDFAGITDKQADIAWEKLIEPNGYASGGKSLHSINKASWSWDVKVNKKLKLEVIATVCKYETVQTGDRYEIKVDDVHYDNDNITLGRTDGNDWYNFKDSKTEVGNVEAGDHKVTFNVLKGVNIDKITLKFTEPGEDPDEPEDPEEPVENFKKLEIDEAGTYKLEAEDGDYTGAKFRSDIENGAAVLSNEAASGGKYLNAFAATSNPAEWGQYVLHFSVAKDCDIELSMLVSMPGGEAVGSLYKRFYVKLDGETELGNPASIEAKPALTWQESKFDGKLSVAAGDHTIVFSQRDASGSGAPYIDYFNFVVSNVKEDEPIEEGPDYTINEVQDVTIEAEDLDFAGITDKQSDIAWEKLIEPNGYASGGKSLHSVNKAGWSWTFDLAEEYHLEVIASVCKYEAFQTGNRYEIKVDDVHYDNDNITLGRTDGNDWYNFKDSKTEVGNLAAGEHTIAFNILDSINVDKITFKFTAKQEEVVETPADYTISEAQNVRIEGENLAQSGIKKVQSGKTVAQTAEPNSYSSNGASLHAVEEAEWSWVFDLKSGFTLNVLSRVGKYEDITTSGRYAVLVDGVEYDNDNITLGHTEDNPWYTFKDSKTAVGNLETGRHTIKFVIKQNINVDFIEFQFTAAE